MVFALTMGQISKIIIIQCKSSPRANIVVASENYILQKCSNLLTSSIRNMIASKTPEMIPIFCVNASSTGRTSFSTRSFREVDPSYKTVRPSWSIW